MKINRVSDRKIRLSKPRCDLVRISRTALAALTALLLACGMSASAAAQGPDDSLITDLGAVGREQTSTTASSLSDSFSNQYTSESVRVVHGGVEVTNAGNFPIVAPDGVGDQREESGQSTTDYTITTASGASGTVSFVCYLTGDISGDSVGQAEFRISYGAQVDIGSAENSPNYSGTLSYTTPGVETGTLPSAHRSFSAASTFNSGQSFKVTLLLLSQANGFSTGSGDPTPGAAHFAANLALGTGSYTVVDSQGSPMDFTAVSSTGTARALSYSAGGASTGFALTNAAPGRLGTTAQLLDGNASAPTQVVAAFVAPPTAPDARPVSDAVDLQGTNSDIVVVKLSFDPATARAISGSLSSLVLSSFETSSGRLLNAVLGNSGATTPTFFNRAYNPATDFHLGYYGLDLADGYAWAVVNHGGQFVVTARPSFFNGEAPLANGVNYLAFPGGNPFGYYSYLTGSHYLYHFDLGYEYVFDAADGQSGVYLYDFASNDFFYTSPSFPFPYLYDFGLNAVLYYYPDTTSAGHYTTGPRYFYNYSTAKIITR